jgi:hypothetical protein
MSVLADLPRRARIAALFGVVSVLCGGVALGFGPLVRASVGRAAERRGVRVQVGDLRLGLGAIWLKNLEFVVPLMPGVKGHVAAVRVGLGWHFNVSELALHGASVELSGATEGAERKRRQRAALLRGWR